ncbi:hypothetical protein F5148DRAFT_139897 [Russula earlei]|uniref:Uncharacterized protein n=1 Tax=Russula earlei TaxID=71964 RepID=A0ACC0U6H0_9AGAM|nr:hypothetical protein F5148DRAFT_139897 [Russula earlei]
MTLLSKGKSEGSPPGQPLLGASDGGEAGSSAPPPPSFEESAGHRVVSFDDGVDMFPAGGEEPPNFTPYEAEHWVSKNGEIVSHDHHLNEDGEALYRFLLSQAEMPPTLFIHCRGTHDETRTQLINKTDSRGRRYTDTESYTETVTDFDFKIEHDVPPRATQWTVGDEEPAYRGRMTREVGLPGGTSSADRETSERFKAWRKERHNRGLPPWVAPRNDRIEGPAGFQTGVAPYPGSTDVLPSSWTLRQWADDYCQSRKIFKEMVYEKVIYGWDLEKLEGAIRAAIKSTPYYGDLVQVSFESGQQKVIVRPDTAISRALDKPWLKFLLIITLIYPFIWLFKRFHQRGGGRWAVGGGAYGLKRWGPVSMGSVGQEGGKVLIGEREGEWFRRWEKTIRESVVGGKVEEVAMKEPTPTFELELDGI